MSRTLANYLDFKLDGQTTKQISGLGSSIPTITCHAKFIFLGDSKHVLLNVPIEVCIDETDETDETLESIQIIFGRRGLFSEFDIEFKERESKIIFQR